MAKYDYWLTEDGLILLQGWARDGLTDDQIAQNMGIGYSTLQTWKGKYQDIQDTLKKGKEVVDFEVENALLAAALEGNTTAQIFWLKNRKPKKWRDKPPEGKLTDAENNLLDAITGALEEDIDTDEIPEIE